MPGEQTRRRESPVTLSPTERIKRENRSAGRKREEKKKEREEKPLTYSSTRREEVAFTKLPISLCANTTDAIRACESGSI